jgi:hypothetical protein
MKIADNVVTLQLQNVTVKSICFIYFAKIATKVFSIGASRLKTQSHQFILRLQFKTDTNAKNVKFTQYSIPPHLQAPVHVNFPLRQVQLCDLQPCVHPHDTISVHDFRIGGRYTSFGDSCPFSFIQPISAGEGRTGFGLLLLLLL